MRQDQQPINFFLSEIVLGKLLESRITREIPAKTDNWNDLGSYITNIQAAGQRANLSQLYTIIMLLLFAVMKNKAPPISIQVRAREKKPICNTFTA